MDVVNFDEILFVSPDKISPGDGQVYGDSLGVPFLPEVMTAWLEYEDARIVQSIDCRLVVEDRFLVKVDPEVVVVYVFNGKVVLRERLGVACDPYVVPETCGPAKMYFWDKKLSDPVFYDRKMQRIEALQGSVREKTVRVRGRHWYTTSGPVDGCECRRHSQLVYPWRFLWMKLVACMGNFWYEEL